jgi:hypothetical protein
MWQRKMLMAARRLRENEKMGAHNHLQSSISIDLKPSTRLHLLKVSTTF